MNFCSGCNDFSSLEFKLIKIKVNHRHFCYGCVESRILQTSPTTDTTTDTDALQKLVVREMIKVFSKVTKKYPEGGAFDGKSSASDQLAKRNMFVEKGRFLATAKAEQIRKKMDPSDTTKLKDYSVVIHPDNYHPILLKTQDAPCSPICSRCYSQNKAIRCYGPNNTQFCGNCVTSQVFHFRNDIRTMLVREMIIVFSDKADRTNYIIGTIAAEKKREQLDDHNELDMDDIAICWDFENETAIPIRWKNFD